MPIVDHNTDFGSAFQSVLYTISGADPSEVAEVEVFANNILQGKKRYRGASSYSVNIAPYLQSSFRIEPLNAGGWLRKTTGQRCVTASIGYRDERTTARLMTAGISTLSIGNWLLSGPRRKRIKATETDEVSFIGSGNLFVRVEIITRQQFLFSFDTETLISTNDMVTLCISGWEIDDYLRGLAGLNLSFEDLYSVEVSVMNGSTLYLPPITWMGDLTPGGVRVKWINRLGAIDCYTFRGTHTKLEKIDKDTVQLSTGLRQVGAKVTTEHTVFSDYESDEALQWIAGVVSAPRVWVDGTEVVTTSDKVGVLNATPGQIELTYNACRTLRAQSL